MVGLAFDGFVRGGGRYLLPDDLAGVTLGE